MAKLANDIPKQILDMLSAVDYSRITDSQYNSWIQIIKNNAEKHIKRRTTQAVLLDFNYPIRQDFCDLINQYDFKNVGIAKTILMIPTIKMWARNNLPLTRSI